MRASERRRLTAERLLGHDVTKSIVYVTDENLHSAFLFDRAIDGTDGQGARAAGRTDMHNSVTDCAQQETKTS